MQLVRDCPPGLRICQSRFDRGLFSRQEQSEQRSRLLHKIHDSYCKAVERLNLRVRPVMAARFLHGGGFCLGFLDPVSNIIANTLISYGRADEVSASDDERDLVYVPEEKLSDLERRSLDGLVTFLTRFFPFLPDCHAVRFLLIADADLMVAVRIVALDRGISRIGSDKTAFDEALGMAFKCAAMAAKHPNPNRLLNDWRVICSRLHETTGRRRRKWCGERASKRARKKRQFRPAPYPSPQVVGPAAPLTAFHGRVGSRPRVSTYALTGGPGM